jgi:hypothetical protein
VFWRGMPTVQNLPDSFTNLTASHYSFGFGGQLLSAAWRCGIFGRCPACGGARGGPVVQAVLARMQGLPAPVVQPEPHCAGTGKNR